MCSKSEHRCTLCLPRETVKKLSFLLEGKKKRKHKTPKLLHWFILIMNPLNQWNTTLCLLHRHKTRAKIFRSLYEHHFLTLLLILVFCFFCFCFELILKYFNKYRYTAPYRYTPQVFFAQSLYYAIIAVTSETNVNPLSDNINWPTDDNISELFSLPQTCWQCLLVLLRYACNLAFFHQKNVS